MTPLKKREAADAPAGPPPRGSAPHGRGDRGWRAHVVRAGPRGTAGTVVSRAATGPALLHPEAGWRLQDGFSSRGGPDGDRDAAPQPAPGRLQDGPAAERGEAAGRPGGGSARPVAAAGGNLFRAAGGAAGAGKPIPGGSGAEDGAAWPGAGGGGARARPRFGERL